MFANAPKTIGRPSRNRVFAGALVILAGAAVVATLTVLDASPPWMLAAIGVTAVIAWLVDGTGTRYVGPGLLALAAGAGILVGNALGMDPRRAEHSLVYGGFGLALLAISYVNPMAARAGGAFLLFTAVTVLAVDFTMGWWLTGILVAWGVYWLVRVGRGDGIPQPALGATGRTTIVRGAERPRTLVGTRS